MPINVNTFVQQANTAADTTKLYAGNDTLTQLSQLTGLKKLSVSAHRTENNSATQSFLTALANDNRYADYLSQVRAPLDALISAHKPLTAGVVRETMQNLELAQNLARGIEIGKTLAADNKIPQGHGTSFGQFVVARDLPLNSVDSIKNAIKEYLLENVVPQNLTSLTKLPDMGSEAKSNAAAKILTSLTNPLAGQDGFFAKQIDTLFEAGFDSFSFEKLASSYQTANLPVLNQLSDFSDELAANIANSPNPTNTLQLFNEAAEAMPQKELSALLIHSHEKHIPLDSPESRANCISHYMVERQGTEAAENIMTDHNLPKEFASAIGHNPEVAANARKLLAENPGLGHVPTQARVTEAIAKAAEALTQKFETQLQEIKTMAEKPICDLNPPLSLATMPLYVNSLLAGEPIIAPLLADGIAIDESFINALENYAEALNSATHSTKGEFGADDINTVAQNTIRILLAKHNVNPLQYLEVMNRIENKFGKLASELTTLNHASHSLGDNNFLFLSKGMTMYRALESCAQALIPQLNHDQKVDLHLTDVQELPPNTPEAQKRERELFLQYIENHFQHEGKLENISLALHDFAEHSGLRMPQLTEAQRTSLEQNEALTLSHENRNLTNAVLAEYLPSTGRLIENKTDEFISLFTQIALERDLTGIDVNKLDITAFTSSIRTALNKVMNTATSANIPVSAESLHKAAYEAMTTELMQLKTILDDIDKAEGFTAEEKINIKDTVQETGLRDTKAIFDFAQQVKNKNIASVLINMASPAAEASQLGRTSLALMQEYLNVRNTLPQNFAGSEDTQKFMLSLALKNANLSNEDTLALLENLNSETAQQVTGTFNWLSNNENITSDKIQLLRGTPYILTQLHTLVEAKVNGNADLDPLFFSDTISGAHQISGNTEGLMGILQSTLGQKIIPDRYIALSEHVPPYSKEEWNALNSLISKLETTTKNDSHRLYVSYIISHTSAKILPAMNKNGEISMKDLWKAIVGSPYPSNVTENNFFETAFTALSAAYAKQYKKARPNEENPVILQTFITSLKNFSVEKLIELAQPNASISLKDISFGITMGDLHNLTKDNAFGLVTDFHRLDNQAVLSFENAQGNTYSVHPFNIPREENTSHHQTFVEIMNTVRNMTHSETQFRRVLQAYSQAALITPVTLSIAFPGVTFSEHGNYQIAAKEQADGSVIVDIKTDETLPLLLHEQFKIEKDGSYICTVFNMSRPAVQ